MASTLLTEVVTIPVEQLRPIVRGRHFCTAILASSDAHIALYIDTSFPTSAQHMLLRTASMRDGCSLDYWRALHAEMLARWATLSLGGGINR